MIVVISVRMVMFVRMMRMMVMMAVIVCVMMTDDVFVKVVVCLS